MKKLHYGVLLAATFSTMSFGTALADSPTQTPTIDRAPIVMDKEYPQQNLKVHSWVTGSGKQMIAHTQCIDMNTNAVVNQLDTECNYK